MPNPSLRFAVLLLALAASGCDSTVPATSPGPAGQFGQNDRAAVEGNLQGSSWRLAVWRPEQQLESMLDTLLAQEYATMVIHFQNGRVTADSATIHVNRAYQVTNVMGTEFTLVVTDSAGTSLRSTARVAPDGNSIDFHGDSDPWRGTGTLRKAQ